MSRFINHSDGTRSINFNRGGSAETKPNIINSAQINSKSVERRNTNTSTTNSCNHSSNSSFLEGFIVAELISTSIDSITDSSSSCSDTFSSDN